jgi:arsenite methyltransferase
VELVYPTYATEEPAPVPAEIRTSLELWAGCVAGALSEEDYLEKLAKAGFDNIDIEATRVYNIDDARAFLSNSGLGVDDLARQLGRSSR